MATDVGGVPYYPYGKIPVFKPVDDPEAAPNTFTFSVGDPFEVFMEDRVTPMVPLSIDSGDPISAVTEAPGNLPEMLLPELEGFARVNGGELFPIKSDDVPNLLSAITGLVTQLGEMQTQVYEAKQAAVESAEAAAGTLAEAQRALANATAGFIRSASGGAPLPLYYLFTDEPVPVTGTQVPNAMLRVRRTATAP